MKVIIPVINDNTLKDKLADSFHNATYSCIYDSESKKYEWLHTDKIITKPGNLSLALKQRGIFAIISRTMPLMALGLFNESGLQVFKAEKDNIDENISLFNQKKLDMLTLESIFEPEGCSSGSCASCSSSCN